MNVNVLINFMELIFQVMFYFSLFLFLSHITQQMYLQLLARNNL